MLRAYAAHLKKKESSGQSFGDGSFLTFSKGQQALFGFWAYRTHAEQSANDFTWWTAFFMAHPERWSSVKNGLHLFRDTDTLDLLIEMEGELIKRGHPLPLVGFDLSFDDLQKDAQLRDITLQLHSKLLASLPKNTGLIGTYIRSHTAEFIA